MTAALPDLAIIVDHVETTLKTAEARCGSYADDPAGFHARHREVMDILAMQLVADGIVLARITNRWDGCRVSIAGISSSSTGGISGALHNWIRAARKRITA